MRRISCLCFVNRQNQLLHLFAVNIREYYWLIHQPITIDYQYAAAPLPATNELSHCQLGESWRGTLKMRDWNMQDWKIRHQLGTRKVGNTASWINSVTHIIYKKHERRLQQLVEFKASLCKPAGLLSALHTISVYSRTAEQVSETLTIRNRRLSSDNGGFVHQKRLTDHRRCVKVRRLLKNN